MYPIKYLLLMILIMISLPLFAAPTIKDYGSLPAISQMVLSSDGKKTAFRRVEGDKDVLVVYSLEQNKVLQVLDVSSVNPQYIYFISDTQLIIRVAKQKKLYGFKGNSHYISAAYILDTEKGSVEQLLMPGDGIYIGQTNVGSVLGISPDGEHVYMPAYINPKKKAGASYVGGRLHYSVMKVDLKSPRSPAKINVGDKDAVDYFMGPKGDVLVQERYGDHSNRHEILIKEGSKWRHIYDVKANFREISPVGLTPDYKSLVLLSNTENTERTQYLLMSLADGRISDPGFSRDDADIDGVLDDINRVVHGIQYSGFLPRYKLLDHRKNQFLQNIIEKFPDHSVFPVSWSDDWGRVLVRVEGSGYPVEYYLVDQALEPKFIGSAYNNIKPDDVHPIAKLTVKARDELAIPTLLTIPRESVANMKDLPAVMLPHGGPRAYDQIRFDWLAQALANEGYLVIQPQFRGSDGFGYKHYEAGHGEWGGKMQDDLTDVLSFLISKGYVNKDKVCIAGASYGGYAALIGGALTPKQYKCVASINGISNLIDFIRDDKSEFGRYSSILSYWENFMTKDGLKKEALKPISPFYLADSFEAPVLLIHGTNDERVRFDQSEMMAANLRKAKKSVQMINLAEENHYLETSSGRLQTLRALVDFVNKNLK